MDEPGSRSHSPPWCCRACSACPTRRPSSSGTSAMPQASRSAGSRLRIGVERSKRSSATSALSLTPMGKHVPQHSPDQNTVIGVCADAVGTGELNDLEALIILLLLVSAGSESTASLIGTGVSILARNQALQERLRENPALVETFVEEACRVDPPFRGHYRRVTRDTATWRRQSACRGSTGTDVASGESRCVRLRGSRCRSTWNATPASPPRLRMGHSSLPRSSTRVSKRRVAFEQLLARTSRFELDVPAENLHHQKSLLVRRLVELPIHLTP